MLFLAYFGPETTLPLASAAAAIAGGVLIAVRLLFGRFGRWFRIGGE